MTRAALAIGVLALVALVAVSVPRPLEAQDIETEAALRGIRLPQSYYDQIERDPTSFQLQSVWRGHGPARVDGAADAVEGEFPLLVIPALFGNSADPLFSRSDIQRVLFDGPAEDGTMTEFYSDASRGRFRVVGNVVEWVRTSLTIEEVVGASFGLTRGDARTGEYLFEAVELADETVDFRLYDNDGPDGIPNSGDDDGFVDAVTFEFQEIAASCGGPAIWPHRWVLAGWGADDRGNPGPVAETDDIGASGSPIKVNSYFLQSATDCGGANIQSAGVISHEFGHALGLPDIYHPIDGIQPAERRWVLGCWGLMAAGSWGCNDGSTRGTRFGPTHLSPWSKNALGWIEWIDVGSAFDEEFVLEGATSSGQALRIPLDNSGREFIVVEYRPREGFDEFLPSSGVLVYHWDRAGEFRPSRDSGTPYVFAMKEADGRLDLQRTHDNGGNRGEASDAWGIAGPAGPISAETFPSSRRNALDAPTAVTIHAIEVDGEVARVRLTTSINPGLRQTGVVPSGGLYNPFGGRLEIAGGIQPYTASLVDVASANGLTVATEGRFLSIGGSPVQTGQFDFVAEIRDSGQRSSLVTVTVAVGEFVMSVGRAITGFVRGEVEPLNDNEKAELDRRGNDNGQYDIGDLRAFVFGSG
jgi:M6 family metalloprotease-like protein